jgi:HPt (histidine-containing phosphotransfer) domain-containing protein
MRSLLSRLAFWWAALAVGLCLALPAPQGSWVAALAVAAAALSLLIGRGAAAAADGPGSAAATGEAGLLDTAAMLVRNAAHAHDLAEALHGAARILFQELGVDGLITGRLDEAGAPLRLDRFTDPSSACPAAPREGMSELAAEAVRSQRVVGSVASGFAVPVLRGGRTVAWLEFDALETAITAPALQRLLELLRRELSTVAERSVWHVAARPVALNDAGAWRERDAANAPTMAPTMASDTRRPAPNESRALLVRYPRRRGAQGHAVVRDSEKDADNADVLDPLALDRLRELDPSGVNRLLERVSRAFDNSATRLIPQLREAARCADLAGVRQVALALRSASTSVGAVKLSHLCADIETMGCAEDEAALARHVKSMVEEIDIVLSVLRSLPVHRT